MPERLAAGNRLPSAGALLAAQVRYQLKLLVATPSALVIGVGLPVILLVSSALRHAHVAVSTVAGFAAFGVTLTAFNTHGIRLVAARQAGILKRWRATPLPRWCYFLGRIVSVAIFATLAGGATVLVAAVSYGLHLTAAAAAGVLIVFVLGASAWAAAAVVVTNLVPVVEAATPVFMLLYFPTIIISGVFGTISQEPHWLMSLASYLPAWPLINAAAYALAHSSAGVALPARDIIVLASWTLAGLVAGAAFFRWEPHRPTQRRAARPRGQLAGAELD